MRFFTLFFIVMWSAIIAWCLLPHDKLPSISFPKGAQHNTFGELPFVEVMDDGDFHEIDGDEEESYYSCVEKGFSIISPYSPSEVYKIVSNSCAYKFRNQLKDDCVKSLVRFCDYYDKTKKNIEKCAKEIQEACQKTNSSFARCEDLGNIFGSSPVYTCNMEFK